MTKNQNEKLVEALEEMVYKYETTNAEKTKGCELVAAYAYKYKNDYDDDILNLILVYDGWNSLLQKVSMNGIYRGLYEDFGVNIWVYTLNVDDFDLDDDSMLLYKNTMILLDKKNIFGRNLEEEKKMTKKKNKL